MPTTPVQLIEPDATATGPEDGMALCLSGGGYRAMVFHVGVLWRLHDAGLLGKLKRISSVSGGSITAALLGLKWSKLSFAPGDIAAFVDEVVTPIRSLAGTTIDAQSIIAGLLLPGRVSDKIRESYEEHLFGSATLQDLPNEPRFVINATNVQSGALWRFMKPYMRDYRVGEVKNPTISLALAAAASSAFPPVLSPVEMKLDPNSFSPGTGIDLQRRPFTSKVILSDGGVYDNLGLETAWKRYKTVFVSDAGGKMQAEEEPKSDWAQHAYRVLDLVDNQVRSLRKRQVIESYISKARTGAYWGIRTNIADYGLPDALPCPFERTIELAKTPTRLKRLDEGHQERLINWGYAVTDTALRRHYATDMPKGAFPYPGSGV